MRKSFAFSLGEVVVEPGQEAMVERKVDRTFRGYRVVFSQIFEKVSFMLLRNNEPYFGQTFNEGDLVGVVVNNDSKTEVRLSVSLYGTVEETCGGGEE